MEEFFTFNYVFPFFTLKVVFSFSYLKQLPINSQHKLHINIMSERVKNASYHILKFHQQSWEHGEFLFFTTPGKV